MKNTKSGIKGVSKSSKNRWKATIQIDKKTIYLGTFASIDEARKAYEDAAIKHGKEKFLLPTKTQHELNKEYYHKNKQRERDRYKKYRIDNKEAISKRMYETRWKIKLEMIKAYGGKCECCGEKNPEFLSIDHIDGGGNQHRKKIKGGCNFYYMLKKYNWPKDKYRLLCLNCNCSYGYYGYCPHQKIENKNAI